VTLTKVDLPWQERPLPDREPEHGDELALFDRCDETKFARLVDERQPSQRQGRREPRPFRDVRTGAGCQRLCPPSEPLLAQVPTEDGGRARRRPPYPRGWAASDPGDGPWLLKIYAELALRGADLSGCDNPLIRAYVARTVKAHLRARWVITPGENEDHLLCRGCIPLGPPWIPEAARQIHALELEDALRKGHNPEDKYLGRMVNTSEYRDDHGECGPELRISHNGRAAYLPDKLPVKVRLYDYSTRRDVRLKGGGTTKVEAQKATTASKPGPKPKFGVTMDAATRKQKQRCEKRGMPFVVAEYLGARRARKKHELEL
jgi:hypothetical protein